MLDLLTSDTWKNLEVPWPQCKRTFSFLSLGHQFVVFFKGQQHGFPLGSHLKEESF